MRGEYLPRASRWSSWDIKQGSFPPAPELLWSSASSHDGFLSEAAMLQTCKHSCSVVSSLAAPYRSGSAARCFGCDHSFRQALSCNSLHQTRVETCLLHARRDDPVNTVMGVWPCLPTGNAKVGCCLSTSSREGLWKEPGRWFTHPRELLLTWRRENLPGCSVNFWNTKFSHSHAKRGTIYVQNRTAFNTVHSNAWLSRLSRGLLPVEGWNIVLRLIFRSRLGLGAGQCIILMKVLTKIEV